MDKLRVLAKFLRVNSRYLIAIFLMAGIFFISQRFPAEIITSESCESGNCQAILESPELTGKNASYYVNDILKPDFGRYYRLTFLTRANRDTKLAVKITNPSDKDREVKTLELNESSKNIPQEIIFLSEGNYSDILFEKKDANDGADVNIESIQISKLEIKNEQELSGLKPTIRGEINFDSVDQLQKDNSYAFNQLKDQNIILGQIFKPQADYVASVTLDIDIVKQDNNGGKKYKFELREAEFDGGVPEITSNVMASVDFTVENIEKYRQEDGKFRFPIFAKLDKEKYYFIGINNNNVSVDKFNYLKLRGTKDKGKYADGTLAVKTKGKTYSAVGSLYFITHQLNFSEYQGKKILGGEIIEDIGKPKGFYTYKPAGGIYDAADLYEYSSSIKYDEDKEALYGLTESGMESGIIYKFYTIFPFKKVKIAGRQADFDWSHAAVSYSYDGNNWEEIPSNFSNESGRQSEELQYFDYEWNTDQTRSEFYVKIAPKVENNEDGEKYGLRNFRVEAELLMR